jgi:HEAT repeats
MYSHLPQLIFQKLVLPIVMVLLIGFVDETIANSPVNSPGEVLNDLVITDDKGSELQLEVRQMPLAKVLESIVKKTHVPIHYSVLPDGLVTATCVGTTLKHVLECLLDRKADLIVRYPRSPSSADAKGQVAEAWILGSRLEGTSAKADCPTIGAASLSLQQHKQVTQAEADRTDELLKKAQSKAPAERAEAIGGLLAGARKGDADVKAMLEQALTDQDPQVRAQAISSYSHREGNAALGAIQAALHDDSIDVRLMAVGGITDDIALLQQAVNDSDETIRSLAEMKLQELIQSNKTKP